MLPLALMPADGESWGPMGGRKRLDPSMSEAPTVTVLITTETRERLAPLAAARGTSRSAVAREFIEAGLVALEVTELEAVG